MTCPGCGMPLEGEQRNPQWILCGLCSWEGHPTEAAVQDEPDDPEELDFC